jgi:hypothetical protein
LLAAVWTPPLLARTVAGPMALPVGFLANLVLFVVIVRDQTGLLPSPHALCDRIMPHRLNAAVKAVEAKS